MTSTPEPDPRLIGAHDIALAALHEITPASTVGPPAGHVVEEDGSVSLRFHNRLPGYPGWYWTVTVAVVDDADPTVLEVELLPGDGALLAPEWVPWAERLAEYRAHQAELAEQVAAEAAASDADDEGGDDEGDDSGDEDSDDEESDEDVDADFDDDFDEDDVTPRLRSGDLDGVDIDELDETAPEDSDDEEPSDTDGDEPSDSDDEE